ncbi:hypothetical protein BV898_19897 [Hypsibius exemplaris]|uniref:Uncharacterized protein n=1 Tax=Hypsibius exemplaris TaxID=2072580 RepID=A0A9X6NMA5_HYPEX|nr:hypothetical protein BV898_19897 [Hypsibius exemplaris]
MQNRNRRHLNRNRTANREQSKTAPPRTAARFAAVGCGLRCGAVCAMEVASNNGSALESGSSASLMDVASSSSTKQSSFANLYTCMSSFYDRSTTPEAAAGLPGGMQ